MMWQHPLLLQIPTLSSYLDTQTLMIFHTMYLLNRLSNQTNVFFSCTQQTEYGGGDRDGFLLRVDFNSFDNSMSYAWTSYFGGEGIDAIQSIAFANGYIFIVGHTDSNNLAIVSSTIQTSKNSWMDGFVASFDLDGKSAVSNHFDILYFVTETHHVHLCNSSDAT
jgi:hypothetical protein